MHVIKMTFCLALLGIAGVTQADTLVLTNGATIDGVVTDKGDGLLEVMVDGNPVFYRSEEVERLEKNDKTGKLNLEEEEARWAALIRELEEKTGLTAEQRQQVEQHITELTREGGDKLAAKGRLVSLQKEFNVFKYLDFMLTESSPLLSIALLDAMFTIDPAATVQVLPQYLEHTHAGLRRHAIAVLAQANDTKSAPQIARGLADHALEVRIEAAYALAALGARNATPALIELLTHPDLRVSNASRDALHQLWKDKVGEKRLSSVDEWNGIWATAEEAHGESLHLAKLEPLVPAEAEFVME